MSNDNLEKKGLMERKGFPESYNLSLLLDFLNSVKSGKSNIKAPVYSHLLYDNVPDRFINVNNPDILIIEGLNVLQPAPLPKDGSAIPYVSDFFDFSIFVDADEKNIKNWYIQRFLKLKATAFKEEKSYFNKNHDHLICTNCDKVIEFCDPRLQGIMNFIENDVKFKISRHSLNFYGRCLDEKNCLKN